ncbi:Rho GTPase-activating protein [Aureispira anguillae]|uniref:Uncharacterized protein n=1 Tax=Aureispira anguillae TaxID=2864201 RepID=A0A916DVV5_9BACT|nr:hypothetical protein [Aureispira anguillae]BDS13466.1 hypothetical protein AsAng_0042040 [Aureispira anguillae]
MHKPPTNHLLQLILSLTKGEKKHFRLLVTRHQTGEAPLFLKLFDHLDKYKIYDEKLLLKRIPKIKKQQLSNLKNHLHKQLLASVRILNRTHNLDITIREQLDYARLLYNKGLYHQSLDILAKTKTKAYYARQLVLILEIIEFEKRIESQYITRSIDTRAEELAAESKQITSKLCQEHELSDLSLLLYGQYLKTGFSRNEEESLYLKKTFEQRLSSYLPQKLSFYGQLYLFQSHIWYYHIQQNFKGCYRYARKWVDLFEEAPEMQTNDCPLYLKGLHNLLSSLFNLRAYQRFIAALELLERFKSIPNTPHSTHVTGSICLFRYIHRIGKHFMEGSFSEGVLWLQDVITVIENNPYNWDPHRIMVFYYKIASLYFGSGDPAQATVYLNRIINHKKQSIREDIQCFTRILNLIAHYELGNTQLIEYQIKSVYRFLRKMKDLNQVQKRILLFLQKTPYLVPSELRPAFIKLYQELKVLEENSSEQRSFLYLDLLSWLESKINNVPVEQVIQEKFRKRLEA